MSVSSRSPPLSAIVTFSVVIFFVFLFCFDVCWCSFAAFWFLHFFYFLRSFLRRTKIKSKSWFAVQCGRYVRRRTMQRHRDTMNSKINYLSVQDKRDWTRVSSFKLQTFRVSNRLPQTTIWSHQCFAAKSSFDFCATINSCAANIYMQTFFIAPTTSQYRIDCTRRKNNRVKW